MVAKFSWTLFRKQLFQVEVNWIYHQKDLVESFEALNAKFVLVRDDNVMQFGGEQVVSHFWQLSDNLYFP